MEHELAATLPDGVYEASSLDDTNEVAQANAAATVLGVTLDDIFVINNMDFCCDSVWTTLKPISHVKVTDIEAYDLDVAHLKNNVLILLSEDHIGIFIRKVDLPLLLDLKSKSESSDKGSI